MFAALLLEADASAAHDGRRCRDGRSAAAKWAPKHASPRYLTRAAEITGLARADRHHWAMPGLRGLPIEPEIVAPCALVDVATRDVLDETVTETVGQDGEGIALAVALVAEGMVDAGGLGESGPTASA